MPVKSAALAAVTLVALALGAPATAQTAGDGLPGWMAGAWLMEDGADWADEFWSAPRGGMMIGAGRIGFGGRVDVWEHTRIVRTSDGSISFYAQPRGAAAAEFPMVTASAEAVEFANPAHDYPQRIRYWRQGQLLMAEIARIDGSDAVRWNFRPVMP